MRVVSLLLRPFVSQSSLVIREVVLRNKVNVAYVTSRDFYKVKLEEADKSRDKCRGRVIFVVSRTNEYL